MQFGLLIVLGAATAKTVRRIRFWYHQGLARTARRWYRRTALSLGGAVWCAMLGQEALLLLSGQLNWTTALPLHLCGMMGVLTLPMLLSSGRFLWHLALYLGVPGAAMALLFPAMVPTPWPGLMAAAFHTLHCLLVIAPLLPLARGWKPSPLGAVQAFGFLLILGGVALTVNALTGANYLFLSLPASGTPLKRLAQGGEGPYRLRLAALCAGVLAVEGLIVWLVRYLTDRHGQNAWKKM